MSKIQWKNKKGWHRVFDMIYDQDISIHATVLYGYLCRCADSESKAWPSYKNIKLKCKINSDATVSKAIKELVQIGLLEKHARYDKSTGGKKSNLYILCDTATTKESHNQGISTPPLLHWMKIPFFIG